MCSTCQGQLHMGLIGNNKDGAQILIKAFYCKEEFLRLYRSIKVELSGGHSLLWCKPSACFPWKSSGKWQLPSAGGDDRSRNGTSGSRHHVLPSFLPQKEAIRRNKVVHLCLWYFHGLKQSVRNNRRTWRYLRLTCTCLFCLSVFVLEWSFSAKGKAESYRYFLYFSLKESKKKKKKASVQARADFADTHPGLDQ